ncbi:DUF4192 domain-containing protein [Agromyces atrinae]|uniref:DUF4192 domain-containing protein n=1 Tax=Agromyces atrinae TaxID=592376 RepID=UPI001F58ABE5|nr:DUF4192 domain-containing protein [Agromyces atrinae]MCI2959018.1 DUF4192 domain-containing protein [Agromyces atrinae]
MTILRASAAHDFLALVPTLTGYRSENSIVCVAFRGNRTAAAFRVDLPAPGDERGERAVIDAIVGLFCRLPEVDAAVPVIYTESTFADTGIPRARFADRLVEVLGENGFLVRDALCHAADAWGSYLDPECPTRGRSLDLIADSELSAAATAIRNGDELAGVDSPGILPQVDDRERHRFERVLSRLRRELSGDEEPRVIAQVFALADPSPVPWVEFCATTAVGDLPPVARAWLLELIQSPPTRDQAMVQFAFGELAGLAAVADQEEWESGVDYGADDDVDETVAEILLGRCVMRPDVQRTRSAVELLRLLVASAPRDDRPAPLCMLGWLLWALGRGSAAARVIETALSIDPDYGMARALHSLLGSAVLPEWAFAEAPGDAPVT